MIAFLLTASCSSVISTIPGLKAYATKQKRRVKQSRRPTKVEGEADHLDPQKSVVAIIQEVLGLSTVDPNNAQEELSTETESHEFHFLSDDSI